MEEEVWKDVLEYEGLYQISNLGRVKSLDRKNKSGCYIKGKILSPDTDRGYRKVILHNNGIKKRKKVHVLVLESFVGSCPDGMVCCHNNGDQSNNRLENLRWDTRSSNNIDAVKHGTHVNNRGENCGTSKLKEPEVIEIRRLLATGKVSHTMLAKMFKVNSSNICYINLRKTWKHI